MRPLPLAAQSKEVPTSSVQLLLVLISNSSHSSTSFFSARTSRSPAPASKRSFLFFTSKVTARLPDLSAMTIFSSPSLSEKRIRCPDFVWIIRVVFSSVYASFIGRSLPFQSAPST